MDIVQRFLIGLLSATTLLGVGLLKQTSTPEYRNLDVTTTVGTVSSFPLPTTQPPITTTVALAGNHCGQWWGLALDLGWGTQDMDTLDYIMWRESRCDPAQHNTDLNADGSTDIGLTQINDRSWCLPTRWYPIGYLQFVGVLSNVGCEELFDPATNLRAARAIYEYHQQQGQRGFEAWGI